MLERTGSSFLVGLVTTIGFIPQLVLAVPAGALADRRDRRLILLWSNIVNGVAVAALFVMPAPGAFPIIAVSLIIGISATLSMPAGMAYLPTLVGRALLPQAVAAQATGWNLSKVVGPLLGGLLVASGFAHTAFAINAISFFVVSGFLLLAPRDHRSVAERQRPGNQRAAFRHVWRTPARTAFLSISVFTALGMSLQTLLPDLIAEQGGRADFYGLMIVMFGIGGTIASVARGPLVRVTRGHQTTFALALSGSCGLGLATFDTPIAMLLLGACAGGAWVTVFTSLQAEVQLSAPDAIHGRVMSLWTLASMGPIPIGVAVGGLIADATGPAVAMAVLPGANLALAAVLVRHRAPRPGPPTPADLAAEAIAAAG